MTRPILREILGLIHEWDTVTIRDYQTEMILDGGEADSIVDKYDDREVKWISPGVQNSILIDVAEPEGDDDLSE